MNIINTSDQFIPPTDCNGMTISAGQIVYCPAGWNGSTPRPWVPAQVSGVRTIAGRIWLDLNEYDLHQVPAHCVSITQPITK